MRDGRSQTFFGPPAGGWVNAEKTEPVKEESKEREEGYYWIKAEVWQPAYYYKGTWSVIGDNGLYSEDELGEVGDRITRKP